MRDSHVRFASAVECGTVPPDSLGELIRGGAMKKYRGMSVSEATLEDFVRQAPDLLEPGLRFVEHQRRTGEGRLDVLLVDRANALVVGELKVVEDDAMLIQAIDYYDYVYTNRDALARAHVAFGVDPLERPRIVLVAPAFSPTLLQRLKWVVPRVSLFTFRCIELDDAPGQIIPVYTEVTTPAASETPSVVTIADHLAYVNDPALRAKAAEFLKAVASIGDEIALDPVKEGVSIKFNGRVRAYLWPYRKRVMLGISGPSWTYPNLDADASIDEVVANVRAACGSTDAPVGGSNEGPTA